MIILCFFLCLACYFDYQHHRIPNWLISFILTVGIARAFCQNGMLGDIVFLIQGTVVILCFFPLFRIGTMGAGDLKLFGVCCGFLPGDRILYFLFFTLFFAAVHSFIRFTRREDVIERFSYLWTYLCEVAGSGKWKAYWQDGEERQKAGICLAGPVLLSMIMYMGGLY